MMKNKIPKDLIPPLNSVKKIFSENLKSNLVGIYIHGSIVMGCYNPNSSDIDLIVVSRKKLKPTTKKKIMIELFNLSKERAINRFEISLITLNGARRFEYPTPFELHFSYEFSLNKIKRFKYEIEKKDKDLAAHLTIIKNRGFTLTGKPIKEVFANIPKENYLDSIIHDTKWSLKNISKGKTKGNCNVPMYAVLNFCRVLAFIQDDLITSKKEGGIWGLKKLPKEFNFTIKQALKKYDPKKKEEKVSSKNLHDLAKYVIEVIKRNKKT